MEEEFKTFLAKKEITVDEYIGGSLEAKAKLVEAFEKSKPKGAGAQRTDASTGENCFRVTAKLSDGKKYSGYRKRVFEYASSCHAMYNEPAAQSIWYPTGSSDLHVSLRFKLEENAVSFIGRLSEMKCHSVLNDNIEINELPETLLLVQPASYVFPHHYRKVDSTSPANSRADTLSRTSEVTNDSEPDKAFRSVEDLTKLAKGDVVYKCHIAPQAFFEEFKGDKDNLIFGSHLFHTYFDGDGKRRPKGKPATWGRSPELWIETLSTGGREMFGGSNYFRINVRIHFRDPEMAKAMQWCFRSGTATEGDTCFTTYFYSSNAANTVKYLGLKKAETQQRWKVAADMETEVEDEDGDEGDAEGGEEDDQL